MQSVTTIRDHLRSKRWTLEIRTGCPVEHDGDVVVEGRAIVRDPNGIVRAFAEHTGTGDSAAVWKLYYDETSRLRVAVFAWANYMGRKADGVMVFDDAQHLERCTSLPGDDGPIFCGGEGTGSDSVDWAAALHPVPEFSKCQTAYHPAR